MINIHDKILPKINPDQLWFMCHVAKFMGRDMTCFPSNKALCEATRWKVSKLNDVKKSCIDAGLMTCESRFTKSGQSSNIYTFKTDAITVWVNLKGKSLEQAPPTADAAPPPIRDGGTPPTANAATEVLTNEVLISSYSASGSNLSFSTVEAEFPRVEGLIPPPPAAQISRIRQLVEINYKIKEGFSISRKIPSVRFDEYLAAFDAEISATNEPHKNDQDLIKHFLNFSSTRYSMEQANRAKQQQASPAPRPGVSRQLPPDMINLNAL